MKLKIFCSLAIMLVIAWGCKKEDSPVPKQSTPATSVESVASSSTDLLPAPAALPISNGIYTIRPMAHPGINLALDVPNGSLQNGVYIQQYAYHGGPNQRWIITYLNNGYYSIRNSNSGKSLDVPGGSTASGVKIQQYTYHGGPNQQWRIAYSSSTGLWRIYNRHSTLALDVPNGSAASGVTIQQYTPNAGWNQTWRFTRVLN